MMDGSRQLLIPYWMLRANAKIAYGNCRALLMYLGLRSIMNMPLTIIWLALLRDMKP